LVPRIPVSMLHQLLRMQVCRCVSAHTPDQGVVLVKARLSGSLMSGLNSALM